MENTRADIDGKWQQTWLRALRGQHNALLRQNATYWDQRAKAKWLSKGYQNTSNYFHNSIKIRHHRNRVSNIKDISGSSGIMLDSPIKAEITAITLAFQTCASKAWCPEWLGKCTRIRRCQMGLLKQEPHTNPKGLAQHKARHKG